MDHGNHLLHVVILTGVGGDTVDGGDMADGRDLADGGVEAVGMVYR